MAKTGKRVRVKVFDFFAGCGGTSKGLASAGMEVILALDSDADAEKTFKHNFPKAAFLRDDIRNIDTKALLPFVKACAGSLILFSGCAPCQPFSKQNGHRRRHDERSTLLDEFSRFVVRYKPDFVFCENVPGLQAIETNAGPFRRFLDALDANGYPEANRVHRVVDAQDYGVPQRRRRLVLLASKHGPIVLPKPTHGPGGKPYSTVWEWIGDLPALKAGETNRSDPNHRAALLSALNLRRIKATPPGGTRLDWPEELKLECHKGNHRGHTDVYGRLRKDQPASSMTTRCVSLSNGRFGHPEQDRAISVREAACLQTFPRNFRFFGSLDSTARQVGNAVPVLLAKRMGEVFMREAAKLKTPRRR
jgi:DNA (cytosine-5)-methyltransferase 1